MRALYIPQLAEQLLPSTIRRPGSPVETNHGHQRSRPAHARGVALARARPEPDGPPNAPSNPAIGVDCAIDRLAAGPLGLGEVEDVDRALAPLVPRVVRDYPENPLRGRLEGFR